MELKLDEITKQFGRKNAINQMSITMKPGVYGLLGANGAGKTTLMRMICGILNPTSGSIFFNGKHIEELGEDYRELLGYLPQNFGYYPDFTAQEFMYYMATLKGISKKESIKRTEELLELVSLTEVSGKKIRTFSGGMKQRLGIAQAVLNNPKILILDEPTAGLDPKERVRFRNLIANFAKDKIIILSTHIVSDVEYISDTILMIKSGKLIENSLTENITDKMEGKVWKCVVKKEESAKLNSKFCVVNLHHNKNELIVLRILSDEKPDIEGITKERINIVTMFVSLVLTILLFFLPVKNYIALERDGSQVSGVEAIKLIKEYSNEISGVLTQKKIKKDIQTYQDLFANPENVIEDGNNISLKDDIYTHKVLPYYSYLKMVNEAYLEPQVTDMQLTVIRDIELEDSVGFYEAREQKVKKYLQVDYSDWTYSKQEIEYWNNENKQVGAPYEYGYHEGWKSLFQCFELLMISIIAICICIAPVFAGEYQSGADSVILCAKYGKSKLVKAKIIAAFLFALIIFTINTLIAVSITLIAFGIDGWNLPLQIVNVIIPYNLSMLEGAIVCIITLYIVLMGMTAFTIFLSAQMKNSFVVQVEY